MDRAGPASLIEDGESGLLTAPHPNALADAVVSLIASPSRRERLRRGALEAVRGHSWEAALEQLASGYTLALATRTAGSARSVA